MPAANGFEPVPHSFWNGLPVRVQMTVVAVPAITVVWVVAAVALVDSRDEESYRFGLTQYTAVAQLLRNGEPSDAAAFTADGDLLSERQACRLAVATSVKFGEDGSDALARLEVDDVIDGCVAGLRSSTPAR